MYITVTGWGGVNPTYDLQCLICLILLGGPEVCGIGIYIYMHIYIHMITFRKIRISEEWKTTKINFLSMSETVGQKNA